MGFDFLYEVADGVATITLARPDRLNALTFAIYGELRDVILDAMERLLARYGYKKTTMDDLAREAGIGKGTTYLHFPSKEEVALAPAPQQLAQMAGGAPRTKVRRR